MISVISIGNRNSYLFCFANVVICQVSNEAERTLSNVNYFSVVPITQSIYVKSVRNRFLRLIWILPKFVDTWIWTSLRNWPTVSQSLKRFVFLWHCRIQWHATSRRTTLTCRRRQARYTSCSAWTTRPAGSSASLRTRRRLRARAGCSRRDWRGSITSR